MECQPGGVAEAWSEVLPHRAPGARETVAERFAEAGVSPGLVRRVLEDGGDALHAAATSGEPEWAEAFGGRLAAALLAAEVSALAAHLNSRASAVRALAVDALLEDYSAVSVAARLGVSRQKVYDIGRGDRAGGFIDRVPWRQS